MITESTNPTANSTLAVVEGKQRQWNEMVLQPILYDLISLGRVLKQLHWNVTGLHFRPIHLHLDEVYAFVEDASDQVAERLAATGHSPSGRIGDIHEHTEIEDAPAGFIPDSEVLQVTEHSIRKTAELIRSRTADIEDVDVTTADMLHQISLGLEKHHWMIAAHRM